MKAEDQNIEIVKAELNKIVKKTNMCTDET